jgi:hypothetical protein
VALLGGLAMLAGCGAGSIERGVFHSSKGYRVALPGEGWQVDREPRADLALKRRAPEGGVPPQGGVPPKGGMLVQGGMLPKGGMLVDATCDARSVDRPLRLLARHLVFGLVHRSVVEEGPVQVAGLEGLRQVVRGQRDGSDVEVEAVVLKDPRCVYDFLYVAPAPAFAEGRPAFRAFLESFAVAEP